MSTKPWPPGLGRVALAEVDSTMAEAARRAASCAAPTWIIADRQTAAHGRRGRPWAMPEGNFAATLLMPVTGAPDQTALRSFTAALALDDAFAAATGQPARFALKWPNDVLLNGGKVAGILLEGIGEAGGITHLAIGIGVNLAAAPGAGEVEARALRPVSLLSETGARVTPHDFLDLLAPAFAAREESFATYGFAPTRSAWLARAARLGETVTARTARDEITGTFETVDEGGHIVLNTPQGRRAIAAAEVFF